MNALRLAIERLRSGSLSTRQFVAVWRNETGPLLAELPSRYAGARQHLDEARVIGAFQ